MDSKRTVSQSIKKEYQELSSDLDEIWQVLQPNNSGFEIQYNERKPPFDLSKENQEGLFSILSVLRQITSNIVNSIDCCNLILMGHPPTLVDLNTLNETGELALPFIGNLGLVRVQEELYFINKLDHICTRVTNFAEHKDVFDECIHTTTQTLSAEQIEKINAMQLESVGVLTTAHLNESALLFKPVKFNVDKQIEKNVIFFNYAIDSALALHWENHLYKIQNETTYLDINTSEEQAHSLKFSIQLFIQAYHLIEKQIETNHEMNEWASQLRPTSNGTCFDARMTVAASKIIHRNWAAKTFSELMKDVFIKAQHKDEEVVSYVHLLKIIVQSYWNNSFLAEVSDNETFGIHKASGKIDIALYPFIIHYFRSLNVHNHDALEAINYLDFFDSDEQRQNFLHCLLQDPWFLTHLGVPSVGFETPQWQERLKTMGYNKDTLTGKNIDNGELGLTLEETDRILSGQTQPEYKEVEEKPNELLLQLFEYCREKLPSLGLIELLPSTDGDNAILEFFIRHYPQDNFNLMVSYGHFGDWGSAEPEILYKRFEKMGWGEAYQIFMAQDLSNRDPLWVQDNLIDYTKAIYLELICVKKEKIKYEQHLIYRIFINYLKPVTNDLLRQEQLNILQYVYCAGVLSPKAILTLLKEWEPYLSRDLLLTILYSTRVFDQPEMYSYEQFNTLIIEDITANPAHFLRSDHQAMIKLFHRAVLTECAFDKIQQLFASCSEQQQKLMLADDKFTLSFQQIDQLLLSDNLWVDWLKSCGMVNFYYAHLIQLETERRFNNARALSGQRFTELFTKEFFIYLFTVLLHLEETILNSRFGLNEEEQLIIFAWLYNRAGDEKNMLARYIIPLIQSVYTQDTISPEAQTAIKTILTYHEDGSFKNLIEKGFDSNHPNFMHEFFTKGHPLFYEMIATTHLQFKLTNEPSLIFSLLENLNKMQLLQFIRDSRDHEDNIFSLFTRDVPENKAYKMFMKLFQLCRVKSFSAEELVELSIESGFFEHSKYKSGHKLSFIENRFPDVNHRIRIFKYSEITDYLPGMISYVNNWLNQQSVDDQETIDILYPMVTQMVIYMLDFPDRYNFKSVLSMANHLPKKNLETLLTELTKETHQEFKNCLMPYAKRCFDESKNQLQARIDDRINALRSAFFKKANAAEKIKVLESINGELETLTDPGDTKRLNTVLNHLNKAQELNKNTLSSCRIFSKSHTKTTILTEAAVSLVKKQLRKTNG